MSVSPPPAASYTVIAEANIYGGERWITPNSTAIAVASIRASAEGRTYASFDEIAFDAEL